MYELFTYLHELIFGKKEEPKFAKPDGYKNINASSIMTNKKKKYCRIF
jgi:hypothetical protein